MDVKEEDILGADVAIHWYYVSKGSALRRILGKRTVTESLDVGAGSGVFSRQLLDAGISNSAVCVDPEYGQEFTETHGGKEIRFTRAVDTVPQKLILMMDVLEHVDDDVALLRQYTDRMADDGLVVITVPAFQFMWSAHDIFLEHRRRYTRAMVEKMVRDAGLEVVDSRYFFALLFPVAAVIRLVERQLLKRQQIEAKSSLKKSSPLMNGLLILAHRVECALLFPVNRLFGLTVFCVARKP